MFGCDAEIMDGSWTESVFINRMKTKMIEKNHKKMRLWGVALFSMASLIPLNAQDVTSSGSNGATNSGQETVELEEFEVTGSRIRRLDAEVVSPVLQIQSADLENIGFPTLGDVVRALPFNSGQALTPADSGTSFTPGVSTVNLRGLGNNQTLVLINGRRAVPYASPGFNGLQTVFDFNSIPQAAIESVEILKDGGSALYGSDAVAGVINVKLRRNYQGVSTTFEVGDYYNTSGFMKAASVVVGVRNASTSITSTFDWREQGAVLARDLDWSKNADKTDLAHKANLRYTATGWDQVTSETFESEQGYLEAILEAIGATDAIGDGWADNRSSRGFPGYVTVPDVGRRSFSTPTDNPTTDSATSARNFYNYQETNGAFPEYRTFGFFNSIRHDFTESLYGFTELSFRRYHTVSLAAATPVDIESSKGLDSGDPMVLPAYNAFNPWGVDITNGRRRLIELPNRMNDVTSDTARVLVGLGGDLALGVGEDWSWEAGVMYQKNSITNLNRGSATDSGLQQALNGLTRLGDGSLTWDPNTPLDERVYFNWFGWNDPAFADFLEVANPTSDYLSYWSYDAQLSGSLFELPSGSVGIAAGFEYRSEKLEHYESYENETGNILGGSEGTSFSGQRSVTAFYAEANIPVIEAVELQIAGRFEDYSDKGFEDRIRPKIGVKFRPINWLLLRASYSESFKAPDLSYLYTEGLASFSSFQVPDPVTGTQIDQIQVVTEGNPDLQPETTDTFYAGIVIEAPRDSKLRGLEISVDYFYFDQTNVLAQLSDFYGYADFLTQAAEGNPLFDGKVVRDPVSNEVVYIRDDYANISSQLYKGFDFGIRYGLETENWGSFGIGINATMIASNKIDGDDIVGGWLTSRWNGTGTLSWRRGDWSVNLAEIYRGERHRDLTYGSIFDEGDTLYISYDVKPQYITNLSVSYEGFSQTTITVGATNLLNQAPPVDPLEPLGTTPGVNNAEPGFWYVRVTRDF